jgi:hypothetical protein
MKKTYIPAMWFLFAATIFPGHLLKAQSGLTIFKDTNKKYGYKNAKGIIVVPAKYQDGELFSAEGMVGVKLNGKWGFIDTLGNEVVPYKYDYPDYDEELAYEFPEYEFGYIFSDGMAAVFMDSLFGFIDKKGKEIVPIKYWNFQPFENGVGGVMLNNKWGFINRSGKEITPLKFDNITKGGFFKINGKWGLIDSTGKELIPTKYQLVDFFREDMAKVQYNDKWGFVNRKGKEVIPPQYERVIYFQEGLAAFISENKWGFIDKNGKVVVPAKYEKIKEFKEGLAAVCFENKWGFIDKHGKVIIPYQYEDVRFSFFRGKAMVMKDGKIFDIVNPLNPAASTGPIITSEVESNNVSVRLVTPPLPLKGNADPSMVGLWKYTDAGSGRITYMKMNADGTTESYLNSVAPSNKSKGFCYWRIDGNFYESICDGATSVHRFTIQKGYDTATGKPTLTLSGYLYVAADNKKSW